jgi:Fe-S-cluster containining protein
MTFKCQRCGKCCGIVPFNKKEYAAIRDYARKNHIGFTKQEMGDKVVYFPKATYKQFMIAAERAHNEGRLIDNQFDRVVCPFLQYDIKGLASCAIYENRPEVCRLFGRGGHPFLTCPNNPIVGDKQI